MQRRLSALRRRVCGFTLIELLVVIAVVAVLTVIAVPSFTQMIAANRVRGSAQDLYSALLKARAEALKRNTTITLRRVGTWSAGWEIVDEAPDPDLVLERGGPARRVTLTEANGLNSVQYLSSGRATAALDMRIEDAGGKTADRCVRIDLSGMPKAGEC
ncbi:GspH/FimT family protein [Fontimonas sp. SYSU GA230001]|uniref:GspH/FimT family pseudopilin n=1 Tax=Fontimonas sp. SYSU GA230001 TaxID=3142450 RepID=UPI0032B54F6C